MKNETTVTAYRSSWRAHFLLKLLCVALLSGSYSWAATYYVREGGSNSASGTSDVTAWLNVTKVNSTVFQPGDVILFKRGNTFPGARLTVSSSGAEGNPIRIGAYDDGAKPVIDATSTQANCVRAVSRQHIIIEDLELKNSTNDGLQLQNCSDVIVRRVSIRDVENNGILAFQGDHVTIEDCDITNSKNNGIIFRGSVAPQLGDSIIQGCIIYNNRANDGIALHQDNSRNDLGANFIVRDNVCVGNAEQGFDITSGSNVLLENNASRTNGQGALSIGHTATGVTVRYHDSENEPTTDRAQTVKITTSDVTIEYSRFLGSATYVKSIVDILNSSSGVYTGEPTPENITLRNNVFAWDHPSVGFIFRLNAGAQPQSFTMQNNIFASRSGARIIMDYGEPTRLPNFPGFTIDNNLYHSTGGADFRCAGTTLTFAEYRSGFVPADSHSSNADPGFVNLSTGDFRLQPDSPAIDAGVDVGLPFDFDGVTVPQGHGRDMGIFEFVPPPDIIAPTLNLPANLMIEATGPDGAVANFIVTATDDTDGAVPVTVDVASGSVFPLGTTTVTATATDAAGNMASDTFTVTVVDTTAPVVTNLGSSPTTLWPANHKMVPVTLTATVSDAVSAVNTLVVSVTSNQPANGNGDGNTSADWEITGPMSVNLRAERSGSGGDRIYTIHVEAWDGAGNVSTASVMVTVPHSGGKG